MLVLMNSGCLLMMDELIFIFKHILIKIRLKDVIEEYNGYKKKKYSSFMTKKL